MKQIKKMVMAPFSELEALFSRKKNKTLHPAILADTIYRCPI